MNSGTDGFFTVSGPRYISAILSKLVLMGPCLHSDGSIIQQGCGSGSGLSGSRPQENPDQI